MSILRIGFIGTGGIGTHHAQGMRGHPDCFSLMAASDIHPPSLQRFADAFQIADRHEDYRRILEDPRIDAVVVLLPHHLHAQVCDEAFAAGKHVLVEKPIARTLAEADRIIASARRHGKTLMIGHNQRYDGRHRGIRDLLDQGALGRVFSARIDHYQDFNPAPGSWWRSRECVGGGCVIGSGIHRLDLLRWFLGEAKEITSQLTWDPQRLEGELSCASTIRFQQGAVAQFLCNWGVHRCTHSESFALYGQHGSVEIAGYNPATAFLPPQHSPSLLVDHPPESMWKHFHRCVSTGQEPLTSGAEGRASLALVLDVVRSGELGVTIRPEAPQATALSATA